MPTESAKSSDLISVADALAIVLDSVSPLQSENVRILDALDRVLSTSIVARDDLPPFSNSSMDGYALRSDDIRGASAQTPVELTVEADIAAGWSGRFALSAGQAARIMTGAPLPDGADCVVPVEDTDEPWRDPTRPLPKTISIRREVKGGDYVRNAGEDVRAGSEVVHAGAIVRPRIIGLLAALGYEEVAVVRRPRVGILATGDELVDISSKLTPGKIRNSNSMTQAAQVLKAGGIPLSLGIAGDRLGDVKRRLEDGLTAGVDLFVSSAGVSVGAFDVVKHLLEKQGEIRFWRVRMRPGKPLVFGSYKGIPYLGLPGNPVSATVSFEKFARPAILKLGGRLNVHRHTVRARLLEGVDSDGRESYLRVSVERKGEEYLAKLAGGQGSHILTALSRANGLAVIPAGVLRLEQGELVSVMMLDWSEAVF